MRPRFDDEFEDDDDPGIEALIGAGASGADPSMAGEMLLELCSYVTKLHLVLEDVDAEEFKAIAVRLGVFRQLVERLPTEARGRRKIGFQIRPKRRTRGRKSHR